MARRKGTARPFFLLLASTMASWFIYVPLHELLHAFGCWVTGGTVQELQIMPLYGGGFLEKVFPFVRAGGDYAGRLTGFDTGGSDLVYLATDFAPYLLTVAGACLLLEAASRTGSFLFLGTGVVLVTAPAISLLGDYYEMGSILVSSAAGTLTGALSAERLQDMRHDDLLALLGEFSQRFPQDRLFWAGAVASAALLGLLLAGWTLETSRRVSDIFWASRAPGKP
ncbi:MAG: hypothetical protein ACE5HD_10225 [Acidobacteriota bacterium]